MNPKDNLKGDLKEIYDRVMNTPTPKKSGTPKPKSQPPTQTSPQPQSSPSPQTTNTPQTPLAQPITSYSFSAKHPNKKPTQTNPKQDKTAQATNITSSDSKMPLFAVGGLVFAVIWGGVWALVFGLI